MPLTDEEFRNRVKAAAALHGLGIKADLRTYLDARELDKGLATKLIEKPEERRPKPLKDLSDALEVPIAWFEKEDWRSMIYAEGSPTLKELVDERDLARLALGELRDELGTLRRDQPPDEEPATGGK